MKFTSILVSLVAVAAAAPAPFGSIRMPSLRAPEVKPAAMSVRTRPGAKPAKEIKSVRTRPTKGTPLAWNSKGPQSVRNKPVANQATIQDRPLAWHGATTPAGLPATAPVQRPSVNRLPASSVRTRPSTGNPLPWNGRTVQTA